MDDLLLTIAEILESAEAEWDQMHVNGWNTAVLREIGKRATQRYGPIEPDGVQLPDVHRYFVAERLEAAFNQRLVSILTAGSKGV